MDKQPGSWKVIARGEVFHKIESECDSRCVAIGNVYCYFGGEQKLCQCINCKKTTDEMIKMAVEECKKLKANCQCPTCKKNLKDYCGVENLKFGYAVDCPDYEKLDKVEG